MGIDSNLKNREYFAEGIFSRDNILYGFLPIAFCVLIYYFLKIVCDFNSSLASNIIYYFILDPSNLNTNVFLSSYTHIIFWPHLVSNVIMYIIFFVLISWLVNNRSDLKLLMMMCLVVYPFVNSIFCFYFSNTNPGNGLSGIVYCLLGYLPFATCIYAKNELRILIRLYTFFIIVLFNLTIYFIYTEITAALYSLVLLIFLFYLDRKNMREVISKIFQDITQRKSTAHKIIYLTSTEIIGVSIAFSLIAFIGFTPNIQTTSFNVGFKVHMFGWLYGLIVSSLILYKDLKLPLKPDILT